MDLSCAHGSKRLPSMTSRRSDPFAVVAQSLRMRAAFCSLERNEQIRVGPASQSERRWHEYLLPRRSRRPDRSVGRSHVRGSFRRRLPAFSRWFDRRIAYLRRSVEFQVATPGGADSAAVVGGCGGRLCSLCSPRRRLHYLSIRRTWGSRHSCFRHELPNKTR